MAETIVDLMECLKVKKEQEEALKKRGEEKLR